MKLGIRVVSKIKTNDDFVYCFFFMLLYDTIQYLPQYISLKDLFQFSCLIFI